MTRPTLATARLSRRPLLAAFGLLGLATAWQMTPSLASEAAVVIPAPEQDLVPASQGPGNTATAVFAGGCFWGVQGVFQHVKGVSQALSGYAGGDAQSARYDEIGSGRTGHAEAVRITYDPRQISYGRLLQIYFSVAHDPTQLNRQGPDSGTQYRSTVFPVDEEQARVARRYIEQLDKVKVFPKPVATTIELQKKFYPAEAYHQDFMTRNPAHPYIAINDLPKVANLKRVFPAVYNEKPALVGAGA
ncbi:Peptide methionine sulfoxide reductase MsrA [Burkholderiales bacterium 8X]|nr:Peptide methionine sulfoxide reductase MsrA [Burkholderiales bacterium 8X]